MQIEEALLQLDVANDDQWTQDGLPRVDVIQVLTENNTVTRAEITAVDPTFSRYPVNKEEIPNESETINQDSPKAETNKSKKEEIEAKVEAVKAELAELVSEKAFLDKKVEDKQKELDLLLDSLTEEFPALSPAQAIQDYLQKSAQIRAARSGSVEDVVKRAIASNTKINSPKPIITPAQ
jgi:predicted nuclease with TOPRIM domain